MYPVFRPPAFSGLVLKGKCEKESGKSSQARAVVEREWDVVEVKKNDSGELVVANHAD